MDEEIDSMEPTTAIFYEMKPESETMYVRTVKPVSSKVTNDANDDSVLQCDCGKIYRTENSLRFHKYECGRAPTFACNFCNYVGKRNTTLRKHIKARHSRMDNL